MNFFTDARRHSLALLCRFFPLVLSILLLSRFAYVSLAAINDITTIAGTGIPGDYGDDGPATSAQINNPAALCVDKALNVFFSDSSHRVRKIDATSGKIITIAGTGTDGYSGDSGLAVNAKLAFPQGVAVDELGNIFIADYYNRVRLVNASNGIITTVAGTGVAGYNGDNILATSAKLKHDLPCMRCFNSGEMPVSSSGWAYTGIRWKLTKAFFTCTAPKNCGFLFLASTRVSR